MKKLLEKLEKVSDYASLQDFEKNCSTNELLNFCYEIEKRMFVDVEDLKWYIIDTLSCDWEEVDLKEEDREKDEWKVKFREDVLFYFEGPVLNKIKGDDLWDYIIYESRG